MKTDLIAEILSTAGIKSKEDYVKFLKEYPDYVCEVRQEIRLALLENGLLQLFAMQNDTTIEEETVKYNKLLEKGTDDAINNAVDNYFKELEEAKK